MADKQIYPMISEKSWWQLRNQFKKTIPSTVNVSYLKSLLSLNSDQSARNILAPLRQMGLIDSDGKPQPRATDWRSDAKYPDVCSAIISEIYPQELLDLFPDAEVDTATAKSWFMDTCSLGDNAAGKITSTFFMLKSCQIKADVDVSRTGASPKKVKTNKPQKSAQADNGTNPVSVPLMPAADVNTPIIPTVTAPNPSVHIDLQIHISPDASPEQIDSIFASMAKHLYGRT